MHDVHRRPDLMGDQRGRVDLHWLQDVGAGLQPALELPALAAAAHPFGEEIPYVPVLRVDRWERLRASGTEGLARLVEEVPRNAAGVHAEALRLRPLLDRQLGDLATRLGAEQASS